MNRNLMYFNNYGIVNYKIGKVTHRINSDYYCEFTNSELDNFMSKHDLTLIAGKLVNGKGIEVALVLEVATVVKSN